MSTENGRVSRSNGDFRAAWWLPGPHAQTVWGRLVRPRRMVAFERERLETPDGDEILLDHAAGPAGAPRLLVLHGLEGSSNSVYVQGLLAEAARRGMRGTALNFRSCARDPNDLSRMLPNRRPRLYHSGETGDLDFVVRMLASREPGTKLAAVGVSLGGNVLLKWLGENPGQTAVAAAAALSTPFDLADSAAHLETFVGGLYVGHFLGTLKEKARATAARFPEAASRIDLPRVLAARTFWQFDDAATAPLHGFAGADDYYRRSSSVGYVARIATPTLCLSAEDDPFLSPRAIRSARAAASPAVEFHATRRGGHIGFVGGAAPWLPHYWAEGFAADWLGRRLARP
ncbi:MAG TPA: alpha/beta fold hydrolase [Thermoanaerobaculia bacterium]|nr:alpha/beta fold hydrolase [Thermoanaerobaculia bacterium]